MAQLGVFASRCSTQSTELNWQPYYSINYSALRKGNRKCTFLLIRDFLRHTACSSQIMTLGISHSDIISHDSHVMKMENNRLDTGFLQYWELWSETVPCLSPIKVSCASAVSAEQSKIVILEVAPLGTEMEMAENAPRFLDIIFSTYTHCYSSLLHIRKIRAGSRDYSAVTDTQTHTDQVDLLLNPGWAKDQREFLWYISGVA